MPLNVPARVTGLEASIIASAKKAGRNLKINLGTSAKSIEGLSQPLGRITGKADQFTKSMEAANARVLAFGASVGVLSAVTRGFQELIKTTVEVEKSLTQINTILNVTSGQLDKFKNTVFEVARNTEQSFSTVAEAALELSRQGLSSEKVIQRLNDAMILSRLSGLGAAEAVAGMTAAINSFNRAGVTSEQVLNKLSAASIKAAVSERDLIEGLKRSASVAQTAGVSLDELVGVISAVQQKTARGGSVIGNSFKTIFTRIQSLDKLKTMQNLGVQVTDVSGAVLSGTKLIQNLAKTIEDLPQSRRLQIAENLVGKFQIAPFLAILDDYTEKTSIALNITDVAAKATNEAYTRNVALNKTLSAAINEATVNLKELANTLGEIGITDSLKNILGFFNSLVGNIKDVLEGEGLGGDFARGIVKGIGNVLAGPGLAIFGAIIAKLTIDLAKFGVGSLKTFFGLNKAAQEQATLQGQIASTLLNNKGIQQQILQIENSSLTVEQKRAAQTKFFTTALNEQLAVMTRMQSIASRIAPGVAAGTRARRGRAAGGFIPNFNAVLGYGNEQSDIKRGVGGAPRTARPVSIPNFNFGGGQRGTMVANSSEFIVPNFAGGSGSAIFNQDMVASMGLPSGARRVGAARGYIPNFATPAVQAAVQRIQKETSQSNLRSIANNASKKRSAEEVSAARKRLDELNMGSVKSGVLGIDAQNYGVASLFGSARNMTVSTGIAQLQTSMLGKQLKERGVKKVKFNNIQIRTLKDFNKNLKAKSSQGPARNRNVIAELFSGALFNYGNRILGRDSGFQGDELAAIQEEISRKSKGEGVNLFSSSVEGGIFEAAVRLVTRGASGIAEFKSHKLEGAPFDFEEGGPAGQKFNETFAFAPFVRRADGKRTADDDAVRTLISKALRDKSEASFINREATARGFPTISQVRRRKGRKGKTAAGGYIPNYAFTPLMEAVERERAAGLPLNQIRINQSGGLRNAQNPMGLAVTNTRDEPTGVIPNFADDQAGMKRASGDLMTKFLGLSVVAGMLSGMFSQMGEEGNNFSEGMNRAIQSLMMLSMMAMVSPAGLGRMAGPGPMANFGSSMVEAGRTTLAGQLMQRSGGINPATGQTLPSRRIPPTITQRAGAIGKIGFGGLVKGLSIFGRLLPVIGQVVFGFQIISGVLKAFTGFDLTKKLGDMTKGLGTALGFIKTPAEKTAEAFDNVAEAAAKGLASGAFGQTSGEFVKTLGSLMPEAVFESEKATLTKEQEKKADDVEKLREQTLVRDIAKAQIRLDSARLAEAAGAQVDPETGEIFRMGRQGMEERSPVVRIKLADSFEELMEKFQRQSLEGDVRSDLKLGETDKLGAATQLQLFGPRLEPRGVSEAQRSALAALTSELALLGGEKEIKEFNIAKRAGDTDLSDEIFNLVTSAIEKMGPENAANVEEMKNLLTTGDPGSDPERAAKVLELFKQIIKENDKNKQVTSAIDKIEASIAKHRLASIQALAKQRTSMVTLNEQNLMTEKELLSTSVKRKAAIETELSDAKLRRDTVQSHLGIINQVLASNESITEILKAHNVQGEIDLKTSQGINRVVADISAQVQERGGFDEEITQNLEDQLSANLQNQTAAKEITKLIKEQVESTDRLTALKNLEVQSERFRKTIMNDTLLGEKTRLTLITKSLEKEKELAQISLERARIELDIAKKEDDKVGKGVLDELKTEREITDLKIKQAKLDLKAQQERVRIGVRKEFFGAAQQAGIPLGQLANIRTRLNQATTEEQFAKIGKEINEAAKASRTARINEAADAKIAALELVGLQQKGGNYVYNSLVTGGRFAANALIEAGHTVKNMMDPLGVGGVFGVPTIGLPPVPEFSTLNVDDAIAKVNKQRSDSLFNVDFSEDALDVTSSLELMKIKLEELGLLSEATIQGLETAFKQAGGVLNTFEMQVQAFVKNLLQEGEDLKFAGFRAVTAPDILANVRGKDRNLRLTALAGQGLTEKQFAQQGIAKEDERAAITGLRDQAFLAGTAREARASLRQIPVLEKIFALKAEINEQGFASIDQQNQLLVLEKERLTVNDSLKAKLEDAFVFTQEEIEKKLNDRMVASAQQFVKTISDGLIDAIVKGENLADILRNAAADWFTDMAKANMTAVFENISSGVGSLFGANSGGPVRGGSGRRDDVPAMLTGGEFVMRRSAVDRYGLNFMEALNRGSIQGLARGGLFTPGTYGQESIVGSRDLLDFATQPFTTGRFDRVSGGTSRGGSFASVALEPQSGALTAFARANDPRFAREQQSRERAFGLFVDHQQRVQQFREAQRQANRRLLLSIGAFALSAGLQEITQGLGNGGAGGVEGAGLSPDSGSAGLDASLRPRPGVDLSRQFSGGSPASDWWGRAATGGAIPYTAGVDTVPTMLSGGEFVMNAAATQRVGRGNLASLNSGAGGDGGTSAIVDAINDLGNDISGTGETSINITVNSDGTTQEDGGAGANDEQRTLATRIRDVVRQTIDEEKRLGGSLRRA
jgi:TP901 family phage tail tape measure protein